MMLKLFLKKLLIAHIPASLALLLVLSNSAIYLTAFEAHVINVTATIERPPTMCNALSVGYWRNHDGCSGGEGESDWTSEIHVITTEFKGIFYDITGAEICEALWIPNCPSGNNILSKRCKATAMALGDELNLVSGHLDIDALIAGADDGSAAFDHLGLTYNSTVRDALTKVEDIISSNNSSTGQLTDAAYVAERIYAFYEDENPIAPQCVVDPITLLLDANILLGTSSYSENLPVEDEENNGGAETNDTGNNENNGGDKHGRSEENSSSEFNNSESEQTVTVADETATSTEESGTTASSTDETVQSTTSDASSAANSEEVVVPDAIPSESTEPTATSTEEQVQE